MKLHKISLLAALAAGALFALTPTLRAEDKPAKPAPSERPEGGPRGGPRGDMLKEMGEKLNLSADQKAKLQEAFKAQRVAMKDLTPEERREQMKETRKAMDAKFKEILTAEQYAQWEKQRHENRPPGGAKPAKKEKPAN
jgi:Spy/CpxP family protein refolding chaperone